MNHILKLKEEVKSLKADNELLKECIFVLYERIKKLEDKEGAEANGQPQSS